jgi:hypothetical protein
VATVSSQGSVRLLTAKDGGSSPRNPAVRPGPAQPAVPILESPAPVTGYVSTLEVSRRRLDRGLELAFQVKDGTAEAVATKAISGIYRIGLDNLSSAFD